MTSVAGAISNPKMGDCDCEISNSIDKFQLIDGINSTLLSVKKIKLLKISGGFEGWAPEAQAWEYYIDINR